MSLKATIALTVATLFLTPVFSLAAHSADVPDPQLQAQAATAATRSYVNTYGVNGKLLDIDATTGEVVEYVLVGNKTDVRLCKDLVMVFENFTNTVGEMVNSNFVLGKTEHGYVVTYQSFGNDPSLNRVFKTGCTSYMVGEANLRLATFTQ